MPGTVIEDNVVVRPFSTVSGRIESGSLVDGKSVSAGVFTQERIREMIANHLRDIK